MQSRVLIILCIVRLLNEILADRTIDLKNNFNSLLSSNALERCDSVSKTIYITRYKDSTFSDYLFRENSAEQCLERCCKHLRCFQLSYRDDYCYGYALEDTLGLSSLKFLNLFQRSNSFVERRKRNTENEKISNFSKACMIGMKDCPENEVCTAINNRRRNGNCQCKTSYERNQNDVCVLITRNGTVTTVRPSFTSLPAVVHTLLPGNSSHEAGSSASSDTNTVKPITTVSERTEPSKSVEGTTESDIKKLVVNISNKTVSLPKDSDIYKEWVTLSAYALGDSGSNYKYNWNLLNKPESKEDGQIRDMNSQTISLSDLVAGVYVFKVSVTGTNSYGEAVGNVTVTTAKHKNNPPVAVVVPSSQTIKLPNSGVILDGSGSSDDNKVASYHWELVMGPLGYKLNEETGPTLQMADLIPGNYTIMLKVKDEDGLEGNTTASVVIVKETDYPPTANAGGDKIIYKPQTEITLNGNMSTDDHGIVEWEWTKGPEDSGNAVDMQDTRTMYLHLSNLEEGHYHFILKVVDTAGQASNSSAHVYVHPASDNALKANAGPNTTIVIPVTTVILDGSKSTGFSPETKVLWKQLSGPSQARLSSATELKTNASDLTRGSYEFQLVMWNVEAQSPNSTSNMTVTVIQDRNAPPVVNAGGDFSVTLPVSVVIVNGTRSTDDVGIVRWLWQRDPTSLAAATVIKKSDETSVLLFTGVVPGRYVWNLTVWDDQGSSASDTVSIIVKEGPNALDEVEIVVGVSIEQLSVSQMEILFEKLQLLLHNSTSDVSFKLIDIHGQPMAGKVSLVVLGTRNGKIMKGTSLAEEIREKTFTNYRDRILNLPILKVDTVICQNNCSGHGDCIQATKECRCHSWWMESFFNRHYGDAVPNCDWSVVYVFVSIVGAVFGTGIFMWMFYAFLGKRIRRFKTRKSKVQHYSLLDNYDDGTKMHNKVQNSLLESGTETDSETEVLFETARSSKHSRHKNGHIKLHKLRA